MSPVSPRRGTWERFSVRSITRSPEPESGAPPRASRAPKRERTPSASSRSASARQGVSVGVRGCEILVGGASAHLGRRGCERCGMVGLGRANTFFVCLNHQRSVGPMADDSVASPRLDEQPGLGGSRQTDTCESKGLVANASRAAKAQSRDGRFPSYDEAHGAMRSHGAAGGAIDSPALALTAPEVVSARPCSRFVTVWED